jgi:GntR family transcriptional regulator
MPAKVAQRPGPRPLYAQVRQILRQRIEAGILPPGVVLPSEFALADELAVSQGTVRKALDALAEEGLIVRRQGRGTFVAEHTAAEVLFRFFKIYGNDGERVLPESCDARIREARATRREARELAVKEGEAVWRITRTRLAQGRPFVRETVTLAKRRLPGLDQREGLPNTLYDLFQREYGLTIARAEERIDAVSASKRDARLLGIKAGAPLVRIDRLAYALDDQPIEWRVSLCHLKNMHYLATLR